MKIGIITFHCGINYGAILQAKALTYVLQKIGYECEIINYRLPHDLRSQTKVFNKIQRLIDILINCFKLLHYSQLKKLVAKFKAFYDNNLPVSQKIYTSFEELSHADLDYDLFLCGSDQIWRPINDTYIDPVFYLAFTEKTKISYAPSFGKTSVPVDLEDKIKNYLRSFKAISLREKSGVEILKGLLHKEFPQVLDPTLLITKNEWVPFSHPDRMIKEDYILVFALQKNKLLNETTALMKKQTGYKTISISVDGINRVSNCDKTLYNVGPAEFLSLINNAKIVLTNSFHGTAFSIIFEKTFLSIPHRHSNSRITDLLSSLDIEQQQINNVSEIDASRLNINYSAVQEKLTALIDHSINYLTSACSLEPDPCNKS